MNRYSISLLLASTLISACTSRPPGEILLALQERDRPAFLLSTVREAGYICKEVQGTAQIGMSWEIACADARTYVVDIHASGSMCIGVRSPVRVEEDDFLVAQSARETLFGGSSLLKGARTP